MSSVQPDPPPSASPDPFADGTGWEYVGPYSRPDGGPILSGRPRAEPDAVGTGTVGPVDCTDAAVVLVVTLGGVPRIYRASMIPSELAARLIADVSASYSTLNPPTGDPS